MHPSVQKLLARYLVLTLVWGAGAVYAADTFETTLSNGMKIIVKEDRRAPTVAHMVWYRAGSMDEVGGTTGVAHLLDTRPCAPPSARDGLP